VNSNEIRSECIGPSNLTDLFAQSEQPVAYFLREIAAQLAELNETLRNKTPTVSTTESD